MSATNISRDLAALIKAAYVSAQSGVAAGTGDNTELTSSAIDRLGMLSGVLVVGYQTSLAASETLKLTVKIAESDDGTAFGTDTTLINALTLETGAATARRATYELGFDLSQRKRYLRFKLTMDCSAGATDVFIYGATFVMSGADRLPI